MFDDSNPSKLHHVFGSGSPEAWPDLLRDHGVSPVYLLTRELELSEHYGEEFRLACLLYALDRLDENPSWGAQLDLSLSYGLAGELLHGRGRFEEAKACYRQAAVRSRSLANRWCDTMGLALAAREMSDWASARDAFRWLADHHEHADPTLKPNGGFVLAEWSRDRLILAAEECGRRIPSSSPRV